MLHLLVGFSVAYAFTGSIVLAGGIALIEPVVNAFVFFFHEKVWNRQAAETERFGRDLSGANALNCCRVFPSTPIKL